MPTVAPRTPVMEHSASGVQIRMQDSRKAAMLFHIWSLASRRSRFQMQGSPDDVPSVTICRH